MSTSMYKIVEKKTFKSFHGSYVNCCFVEIFQFFLKDTIYLYLSVEL